MRTTVLAATLILALPAAAQTTTPTTASTTATHTSATTHKTSHKSSHASAKKTATRHHTAPPAPKLVVAAPKPAAPVVPAVVPTPYAQNPIQQLRGSASAILIFAPDTKNPDLITQFTLLERNEMTLTDRDVILVPNIAQHHPTDEAVPGENISPGSPGDQLSARLKFNIKPTDFTIIVLDKDGTEKLRSNTPVDVSSIGARLDSHYGHAE